MTDTAQRSTHLALIASVILLFASVKLTVCLQTLWFMQASLSDISAQRDSPSFIICQRILHKCHEIIFGDQVLPSGSPYSGFVLPAYKRLKKVMHNAEPVFIGLGVMLASTPAMPQLAEIMGQVAIEQGRREEAGRSIRSVEVDASGAPYITSSHESPGEPEETGSPASLHENEFQIQPPRMRASLSQTPPSEPGDLPTRRSNFGAQTLPALPLHLQTKHRPALLDDPLGQMYGQEEPTLSYQSSPSLASARTPARSAASHRADLLLEQYDSQSQMHLLRGHYYLSEVRSTRVFPVDDFEMQKGSISA